ncbi:MAG TPA: L-threonylcarbamoyladenylate synthase [Gammaproteobacteria bacterium]|nr:L-threonylcarbamoyladenylate synthase [Gammaproteobacteria bacterium]
MNRLVVHPENPQSRLIARVAAALRQGEVIVYPTDSSYALGCALGDKAALDRIRQIRRTEIDHDFTLVCRDLSEIAMYARVDNSAYRLLKSLTPGPYTFILRATSEAPRRLQNPKRKSIGIRVPDNRIAQAILEELGEPLMSSTLQLPEDDLPLTEPDDIEARLGNRVDIIVDGGACGIEPTTVLDLSSGQVDVVRRGKGSVESFSP